MPGVPVLSHRVRGPGASNKLKSIFCGGVHVAKNTLRGASLGPEELASADPTVDVGPVSQAGYASQGAKRSETH